MNEFLSFFETMPNHYKLIWIFSCLAISWFLEFSIPLTQLNYKKWRHAGRNLIFLATSLLINLLFGIATIGVFFWLEANGFGMLNWIHFDPWLELLIAVMALDFIAQWLAHYLLHRVKWMWKFHLVHHSDTHVDATTGTRHHPGDYFIREVFALATVVLFGIPIAFYIFYKITTIFFTYFSHANIRLPAFIDKALVLVFITPNLHKFHHHFERPWTDSNFGNIFSIWDRIFGTFVYTDPLNIRYGVDVLEDHLSDDLVYQFKLPFDSTIKTD